MLKDFEKPNMVRKVKNLLEEKYKKLGNRIISEERERETVKKNIEKVKN